MDYFELLEAIEQGKNSCTQKIEWICPTQNPFPTLPITPAPTTASQAPNKSMMAEHRKIVLSVRSLFPWPLFSIPGFVSEYLRGKPL